MTTPNSNTTTTTSSTWLDSMVSQLLQEVGVLEKNKKNETTTENETTGGGGGGGAAAAADQDDIFLCMDQWLGITSTSSSSSCNETSTSILTVEDCAPFSLTVYQLVAKMIQESWNPTNSGAGGGGLLPNTNVFIQELHHLQERGITNEKDISEQLTLESCLPSIRVTRWIRQWMEYNVQGDEGAGDEDRSFSHYLLLDDNNNQSQHYAETLLQSLFVHMMLLPTLQSQLLLFHQAFQRGDFSVANTAANNNKRNKNLLPTTPKTTALPDPTKRLQHYQLAQQFAQKLTTEYNDHLNRLEFILGEWYSVCAASANLRSLARAGLSRLWMKFCLTNASTGASGGGGGGGGGSYNPSLRGENTTATGLDVTLRVLYRILLGMKQKDADATTTTNILEDLLFHQLLPLHQPNAMVLWRDQTSLLELYHEPLVQCMAYILKQQPSWIAPICQALLLPSESIWPMGGNTPKQVLLLHEVDTFLGMLATIDDDDSEQQPQQQLMEESTFVSILTTIGQCMASEHSRLAERALTLMRNTYFKKCIMETYFESSLKVLLPTLTRKSSGSAAVAAAGDYKNSNIPWNPTVRKMTFHVLKNLQNNNEEVFAKVSNQLFGHQHHPVKPEQQPPPVIKQQSSSTTSTIIPPKKITATTTNPSSNAVFNQRFSLQAAMGDWRPPPSASSNNRTGRQLKQPQSQQHTNMPPPTARPPKIGGGGGVPPSGRGGRAQQPPLSITGVAPWAATSNNKMTKNPPSTITGVAPWAMTANNSNTTNSKNPPSTITGVAPWANQQQTFNRGGGAGKPPPPSKANPPGKGSAPWATGRLPPSANPQRPMPNQQQQQQILPPQQVHSPPTITEDNEEEEEEMDEETNSSNKDNNPGLRYVLQFMEQCKPPGMDENEDEHASSAWSKAQMSETPTLLPDLKFHDLVFGQELGHGAFGVVKYARLIDRTKTRSHWAEYAVKVIATERMKELGYEYSVAREIASLHLISHPNVARLVSSFRFDKGAYLVLEYASGGDLHQLLQQHGSLDVPSSRFVLGEIVSALASLHDDLGFVYGDLKPENVVISETGHIKLTDFGACRPYTDNARTMLQRQMGKSGKNLLGTLREGDPRKFNKQSTAAKEVEDTNMCVSSCVDTCWGVTEEDEEEEEEEGSGWMSTDDPSQHKNKEDGESKPINDDTMEVVDNSEHDTHKEDLRIEGTTAYLPPEVVLGSIPTPAADSWALGCVLYQCLSGRPPILEADESQTRSKIVTFDSAETDPLFGADQKHAADIPDNAKALIRSLLDRVAHNRPSMQQTAQHDFFEGEDVMRLYQKQAYPLDVGGVAPAPPDAQWSRRQFSSIWAPQPQAYDISGTAATATNNASSSTSSAPIPEGDEAGSPFTPSLFYRVAAMQGNLANPGHKTTTASAAGATATNGGHLAQQPLAHIEEDDVSMASSTEERMSQQ